MKPIIRTSSRSTRRYDREFDFFLKLSNLSKKRRRKRKEYNDNNPSENIENITCVP